MADRNMDRERRMRESDNDNDWDWYYYEYRYEPYYPGRNYGNREGFNQDYNRNYGRSFNQNYGRNDDQDYDRGYGQDYGRNYNQLYGRNMYRGHESDYDRSPYWMAGNGTPGRYSGVGPRGYRRSDERMIEDINDRLTWNGQIDATNIEVDVKDGIATLSGSVNSRQDKRMAEYIAENVSGVTDVQNNLKINTKQTDWNRGLGSSEMDQGMQKETTSETSKRKR
jgi:hypothetical protein